MYPEPIPDAAFGFVLDERYRRRWAQDFLDKEYYPSRSVEYRLSDLSLDEKQRESTLLSAMVVMNSTIPRDVYAAVPGLRLPLRRRRLLPVKEDGFLIPRTYVFVLHEGGPPSQHPTPEHVELVRKALGLGEEHEPVWVPIYRCVETDRQLHGSLKLSCVDADSNFVCLISLQGDVLSRSRASAPPTAVFVCDQPLLAL